MFIETTATVKIKALAKRIQGIAGGTSASKTISALMKLIDLAMADYDCSICHKRGCLNKEHKPYWDMRPTLTSVVSESMPHLKRGAMRDFLNIMVAQKYFKPDRWSKANFTYTFETGSILEFFSADSPDKVRGPRRDRLFLNEGNNVTWHAADQLIVRTRELVIVDWNPTSEFWWYTEILPHRDVDFITVTYLDNEALEPEIVEDIESHKHNKNWWTVYGEGQLGEAEGKVYSGWNLELDTVPHEARLERRGLDFGFTNDPAGLVDVYKWNGAIILDEQIYRKGMKNREIATYVNALPDPNTLIIADSSEPKSIDELRTDYNLPIIGAIKGQGSVNRGIAKLQDQRVFVTKRSVNLIREYRNYMWETDKDGKIINTPIDDFNHLLDAARYAVEELVGIDDPDDAKDQTINTGNVDALIY